MNKEEFVDSRYVLVGLLSFAYGAGELLQLMHIGPIWLRWYLSAFGFPFSFAFGAKWILRLPWTWTCALIAGGVLATAFELFQFTIGVGDPIDIFFYAAAVITGLLVVRRKQVV